MYYNLGTVTYSTRIQYINVAKDVCLPLRTRCGDWVQVPCTHTHAHTHAHAHAHIYMYDVHSTSYKVHSTLYIVHSTLYDECMYDVPIQSSRQSYVVLCTRQPYLALVPSRARLVRCTMYLVALLHRTCTHCRNIYVVWKVLLCRSLFWVCSRTTVMLVSSACPQPHWKGKCVRAPRVDYYPVQGPTEPHTRPARHTSTRPLNITRENARRAQESSRLALLDYKYRYDVVQQSQAY